MRRKKEEKEQRMNERDYQPHAVCMPPSIPAPTCMIPTMSSAHGMTSGVPSPPTWMIHGMTSAMPSAMPSAPTMLPIS